MSTPTLEEANKEARELIPEDKLSELLAEHPGAYFTIADTSEGEVAVVFKRFTTEQFKRVHGMVSDKSRISKVAQTAWRDLVIYPTGEQAQALLDECPALDDQIATLAFEIARGKAPEEATKRSLIHT